MDTTMKCAKMIKIPPKFCGRKARKSAALTVKKTRMQSWQNFGHEQDSNYLQANKVFWQTVRRLRGKWSHTARSIKDQNRVLLRNEKNNLGRWKEKFKYLLNLVTITPQNTHHVHLGEENTITAVEVSFPIKALKGGKDAGCDEIRREMLKALNRGILWLTRACQVAWCSGRNRKIGKLG